ncbi:MAG: tryptophan halogenase, partial [Pseudomonadota bacterium]|nr:tryptophan halogenase [Pseudomonadota bacterium]
SWIQVFLGQGVIPAGYDPLVDVTPEAEIERFLNDVETVIGKCVAVMPSHADYVARVCSAVAA